MPIFYNLCDHLSTKQIALFNLTEKACYALQCGCQMPETRRKIPVARPGSHRHRPCHMQRDMSTRPSKRNGTPSASNKALRNGAYSPPVTEPSAFTTRCQGTSSGQQRIAQPTWRAARALPRRSAICPYVVTQPRGICATTRYTCEKNVSVVCITGFPNNR